MDAFIPVNEPLLDGNEKKYLAECIDSGWISSEGPFVGRFEKAFARAMGRSFGISVSNGSDALELAVKALGIGPGDEVIMPTFTIISCVAAVLRAGATPVLVDCDTDTWNMDVIQVSEKITTHTKAIMVVHIYGLPVDLDPILALCEAHGLKLIEDAAEAIGLHYNGKPCGGFGDISIFSLYANKHVTTGEGGMIATNDPELAEKCEYLRNLGFRNPRFVHDDLAWNMRFTNIQAAVGLAQLERLDFFIEKKKNLGRRYDDLLGDISVLQKPVPKTAYAENVYWVYGLVIDDAVDMDAKAAMAMFAEKNIGTRPFFWSMHEQPVLMKLGLFAGEKYAVSERISRKGFYLPSGLGTTNQQIDQVAEVLRNIFPKN